MLSLILAAAATVALPISPGTVERLLEVHGWGKPTRDPALDEAAAQLTRQMAGPLGKEPPEAPEAHLRHALDLAQVSDAQVFPLTLRHRKLEDVEAGLPALLGRLERRLPPTHYGLSTHGSSEGLTTTLLLVHRGLELAAPMPRTARPGDRLRLEGPLLRGYFRPRVLVAPPLGQQVRDRPAWVGETSPVGETTGGGPRLCDVTVYFDAGPGAYGVEIIADSEWGPVVLHNHNIYVGVDPPALPVVHLRPVDQDPDRVRALLDLLNRTRERAGVGPLVWSKALAKVAATHAQEVAKWGTLAHRTPDSGTLATRLRELGADSFARAAENLAYAGTAHAALSAFMDSPGHKRNVLSEHMTHVGVAVVGRYFVVDLAECPRGATC